MFLLRQFKNLAKSLLNKKEADSTETIIADNVYAIGKKFDLPQIITLHSVDNDICEYNVQFNNYFNITVTELKSLASNLDCIQLGYYFTIISHLSYTGNMIENKEIRKPMRRKELTFLLQISNESCKKLVSKFIENKLLSEGSKSNKLPLYCPENIVFKKKPELESDFISTIKKKNPRRLIFSGYVFGHSIFQKVDRKMRKNIGKETFGVFIKLMFLMNDEQEIKSRHKKDVLSYINSKMGVTDFSSHFKLLVESNFVQLENNIVYINPTSVKKYRKNVSENLVRIFDLNGEGGKMHSPLN